MNAKDPQFADKYLAALRAGLERPTEVDGAAALVLGQEAWDTGVGIAEIAVAHTRAMNALGTSDPTNSLAVATRRKTERFLRSAMAPSVRGQRDLRKAAAREHSTKDAYRKNAAALAVARQRLRSETSRAQRAETSLAKGARHYRVLLTEARNLQDQLRRMARRVLSAQEEERKQISRELHDEIAQVLASINVQLAILKQESAVNDQGFRRRIAHAQRFVEKSVTAVHRFARELRPALLDDLGLVPALRSFIRTLVGRRDLRIRILATDSTEIADPVRRTVLYRVAQEALINVVRHARAQQVTLRVRAIPGAIELEINDDGRSFDVQKVLKLGTTKHLGLLGMRERVEMVGGTFGIESTVGQGTTVRAVVPFGKNTRSSAS